MPSRFYCMIPESCPHPKCMLSLNDRKPVDDTMEDFYHGNKNLPVYLRQTSRLDTQEIAEILLEPNMDEKMLCTIQPLNIGHNTVFVVDLSKFKNNKDILCDDMGSWKYNGIFTTWIEVDDNGFTKTHGKKKPDNMYQLTKKYFVNKISTDLKKTVAFIAGKTNLRSLGLTCNMGFP